MTTDPIVNHIPIDSLDVDATTALMLTTSAQQAVLPRKLDDGHVYAALNADGAVELLVTPGYTEAQRIAQADRPDRVKRTVKLTDAESFLNYLRGYLGEEGYAGPIQAAGSTPTGELEVWASADQRTVTAYLDGLDGWRKHTAILTLDHSREWAEWAAIDGKLLPQVQFAQFIEDHISTIGFPDGAQLLDICQTLQANTNVDYKSSTVLANGQRQFRFEERLEARAGQRGDLTIPGELTLVLRPFRGSEPQAVTARFRYRISDGQLQIGVRLAEPQRVIEDAFAEIVTEVDAELPVPILNGVG